MPPPPPPPPPPRYRHRVRGVEGLEITQKSRSDRHLSNSPSKTDRNGLSESVKFPCDLEFYSEYLGYDKHEGSLEILSFSDGRQKWQRRWFVLNDGILSYYSDEREAKTQAEMENDAMFHDSKATSIPTEVPRCDSIRLSAVEAIRTEIDEEKFGKYCFSIFSSTRKLTLRANSTYSMQGWLLKLHSASASVINSMVEYESSFFDLKEFSEEGTPRRKPRRNTVAFNGDERRGISLPFEPSWSTRRTVDIDIACAEPLEQEGSNKRRPSYGSQEGSYSFRSPPLASGSGCFGSGPAATDSPPFSWEEDDRNGISFKETQDQSQEFGGDGDNGVKLPSEKLKAEPSKYRIPSQLQNGCCGNFGGDLQHGGLWWTCGCCSIVGRREKQEDRYCVIPRYDELVGNSSGGVKRDWKRAGFFGIYDGHCGAEAAQFVADELPTVLAHKVRMGMEPRMAVTETILELDSKFLDIAEERDLYCGSTAILVLLLGKKLLVGGIGDCEALLCKNRSPKVLFETHRPDREDEMLRIKEAGGWVTTERELSVTKIRQMDLSDPEIRQLVPDHFTWNSISRLCGELSVSRSIGDRDFKGFAPSKKEEGKAQPNLGKQPLDDTIFNWPMGHKRVFYDNLVVADPEIKIVDVEEDDNFVIIACDGFWDVLKFEEAIKYSLELLDDGKCAQYVSQKLCQLAVRMGSSDNVTVVVVTLNSILTTE